MFGSAKKPSKKSPHDKYMPAKGGKSPKTSKVAGGKGGGKVDEKSNTIGKPKMVDGSKSFLRKKPTDNKPGSPVTKPGPKNQGTGKVFKTPESKKPGKKSSIFGSIGSKAVGTKVSGAKAVSKKNMKKGGKVKCMAGGGYVRAADGVTKKGKTKGKMV